MTTASYSDHEIFRLRGRNNLLHVQEKPLAFTEIKQLIEGVGA